eukprot:313487_1
MATLFKRAIQKKITISRVNAVACLQMRLKIYLVGVDGSNYSYNALKTATLLTTPEDKLISIYFPPNMALYTMDVGMITAKKEHTKATNDVLKHCKQVVDYYGVKNINYDPQIGDITFSAKNDIIQACYDTHADVLFLGAKGFSHNIVEKISQKISRAGSTADYCLHQAPCDVFIVKQEHENLIVK